MSTSIDLSPQDPAKNKWKGVLKPLKVFLLFVLVCLGILTYVRFGPHARQVDITISVVDANTGLPVPNAKLEIMTDCYYLLNNAPRLFHVSTDNRGKYHFRQTLDYAVRQVGVIAWNADMTKRAVVSQTQSALLSITEPNREMPNNITQHFTLLYPNRGDFYIAVGSLVPAELARFREWYEWHKSKARTTRRRLADSGIEVAE
jgi:hypothetical protein